MISRAYVVERGLGVDHAPRVTDVDTDESLNAMVSDEQSWVPRILEKWTK